MADASGASLFERIGGSGVVDIMVERFYGNMDSLPEAAALFHRARPFVPL